jgi:hypothetical protein
MQSAVVYSEASGGSSDQVPKKAPTQKFFQHCKTHDGPYQMHKTSNCRHYDKDGKPLGVAVGKPSSAKKLKKKFWGKTQVLPSCRPCSRLMKKSRKIVSSRNTGSVSMCLVTMWTVNRELGVVKWNIV